MKKHIWLATTAVFLSLGLHSVHAQQKSDGSAEGIHALPAPTQQGQYDPDHPGADSDGFVWKKKGSGFRVQGSEVRGQEEEVRGQKSEVKGQKEKTSNVEQNPIPNTNSSGYLSGYYQKPDQQKVVKTKNQESLGSVILKMVGGLGLVMGLVIFGSVMMKRFSSSGKFLKGRRGRMWQVIETTSLGPKRSLYVTRFLDRVLLIGATDQQMTLLSEIQDPELAMAIESGDADFRRFLVPESMGDWKTSSSPPPSKEDPETFHFNDVLSTPENLADGPQSIEPSVSRPLSHSILS